ncbi:MAG: hypothetical protein ACRDIE_19325 [Chloroflexota bacterium]
MSEEAEQARRLYGGREIDPVEAASIHIHLQELRDHIDSYLEIEIDDEDSADRIEADCRAIAAELGMRLHFSVVGTRHVRDAAGIPAGEPSVLQVTLVREEI